MKKNYLCILLLIILILCCGCGTSSSTIIEYDIKNENTKPENFREYFNKHNISYDVYMPLDTIRCIYNTDADNFLGFNAYYIAEEHYCKMYLTFDNGEDYIAAKEKLPKYFENINSEEFMKTTFFKYLENPMDYEQEGYETNTYFVCENFFDLNEVSIHDVKDLYYINYQKNYTEPQKVPFDQESNYDAITLVNIQDKCNIDELKEEYDYISGECNNYIFIVFSDVNFSQNNPCANDRLE